jgi:hypothetical protein
VDFEGMSVADLLRLHSGSLAELRRRGVIRTANAPAGDYAEWLVAEATRGELAPNAQPSWDVKTPENLLLQVKARVISDERNHGQRQLSAFRSWMFHAAVVVLFYPDFSVRRATYLPVELLKEPGVSRRSEHVNASIVYATDELLDRGVDWTDRLWKAAGAQPRVQVITVDGPTPNGGVRCVMLRDPSGRAEIVEYDADGHELMRTYGTFDQ